VSTAPTRPKVLLTAGQTLTAAQVAYVAQLEARARRLAELVDVDLADELARERALGSRTRRDALERKAELARARKRVAGLRARNRRLLALLRTIHPRKENPMPLPETDYPDAVIGVTGEDATDVLVVRTGALRPDITAPTVIGAIVRIPAGIATAEAITLAGTVIDQGEGTELMRVVVADVDGIVE
jgi:hypothetical protein